jgi:hypothetical protein
MYFTFNNIDIASDLSEFEKEFKMQQSIKQYRPKHYFEFFKIIFNSPLYNSEMLVTSIWGLTTPLYRFHHFLSKSPIQ